MPEIQKKVGRAAGLARNFVLVAQVAARHAIDDPALLALQVTRKLPHRAGVMAGRVLSRLPGAGTRALGQQIMGAAQLPETAVRLLGEPDQNFLGSLQRRIAAEVAVGYGLIDHQDASLPATVRARAAWDAGAVSQAIAAAQQGPGARAYARRLSGEATALNRTFSLTSPASKVPARAFNAGELAVLHLLTNSLPATQSGYTLRSHRLLGALVDAGVTITAVTRLGYPVMVGGLLADRTTRVDKIVYRRLLPWRLGATLPQRLQQSVAAILKEVEGQQIDLVHTTTNYQNALVAQAVARSLGVPWVYEVRGVMEETWVSGKKTEAARQQAEASERFSLLRARETQFCMEADAVVTLSQTMKDFLVERGVPAEKIALAPNAVSEQLFEQNLTSQQARQQLGLDAEGQWVGSVTSVVHYEGLDTLLRAVALLRAAGADVRVLIAGDGTARASLERLAAELNLGKAAVFTGRLAPEDALLAHQSLDVFAVPRTNDRVCRSVTPLKPIEAMAVGRPVVMSDIPPLAELVHNAVAPGAGKLFHTGNPADMARALTEFLTDPEACAEAVAQGRRFARTRLWSHNAETLLALYRKTLSNYG